MTVEPNRIPAALSLRDGRLIRFPAVMGVLNVTPDSFSDGGCFLDPARAAAHAMEMASAGAHIIDIGAESSRPVGAREVSAEEQLARLLPVFNRLSGRLAVPFSVDTRNSRVAQAALEHGAAIINDISALTGDPAMASLAAQWHCAVVLMHMKGGPENHMQFAAYDDVATEVFDYLLQRAAGAIEAGIEAHHIILDPGIGFSKTAQHNLAILAHLDRLSGSGYPVLVGVSRKGFIRRIAGADRDAVLWGNCAANALAVAAGAAIIRVHDPQPAAAVSKIAAAVAAARQPP